MKINILIADDHSLYLEGLKLLLNENNITIVDTATNGADAVLIAKKHCQNANLFLLDLHLPDINAIEIVTQIRAFSKNLKIILLTHQKGNRYLPKLKKLGISGYLLKNIDKEEFLNAITTVVNGGEFYSPNITDVTKEEDVYIKSSVIIFNETKDITLSEREKEILVMVCNEKASKEIGELLHISTGTVDTHRKNIMMKLGVTNSVGLVKYALKTKLI
ncbi:MAG: response regulator transcription factor [Ferruginibacter sp.]|nr:response regulator transcription factor [Ferruginibacter sp.]